MSLSSSFDLSAQLLATSFSLFAAEFFWLSFQTSFRKIWSFENLSFDLKKGLPLPDPVLRFVFALPSFQVIVILQIIFSLLAMIDPKALYFIGIAVTQLLVSIRFRGTYNGGSDMMGFVVLTGILIGFIGGTELSFKLGLIYICIHALYSYFKSGLAKIRQKEWRNGTALSVFLERSLFVDIRRFSFWLGSKRILEFVLCWSVLLFEIGVAILLFAPNLVFGYFLIAFMFHFAIYLSFGLNRFFLIWLSAWPSILYSLSLL